MLTTCISMLDPLKTIEGDVMNGTSTLCPGCMTMLPSYMTMLEDEKQVTSVLLVLHEHADRQHEHVDFPTVGRRYKFVPHDHAVKLREHAKLHSSYSSFGEE